MSETAFQKLKFTLMCTCVQFAISLTFLRSIFMKITENINVLPTV